MPIPSGEAGGSVRAGAVAWLRLVADETGPGARAGLLVSSVRGEPLEFYFASIALEAPPGALRDSAWQRAASPLVMSVFRAATASPVLLFGLTAEVSADVREDFDVALPVCRVDPMPSCPDVVAGGMPGNPCPRVSWAGERPGPATDAGRAFDGVMEEDDPFAPLERVAKAVAVACADPRVGALTGVPGLVTMIALPQRLAPATRSATPESGHGLAARLWAVLAAPPGMPPAIPGAPVDWPGDLMPFQQDGVRVLLEMDRLLLADDMGLGKTVQAVTALRILRAGGKLASCLVVAPAGVLDQWRGELDRRAPELTAIIVRGTADDRSWQWAADADVTLASYDVLRSDARRIPGLRAPRGAWDVVVVDEAQRIKNRNETSEAVKGLHRTRSWALTGTPVENHEEELASIMEFVDHDGSPPLKRCHPGAALFERHRELQLRRKKSEVLDELPPKLETKVAIALHPDQRDSYDRAEREGIVYLRSLGAEVGIRHVLELITRLKQLCNMDPRTGTSSKLDDIKDRLETLSARGHKALVFSQYASETAGVAAAARHLRAFDPLTLTGQTPPDQRPALIDRFMTRDAHKVLIVSLRAGGLGLNLQQASYVFHLDRWWNPAVERQAEDRTHRIGQTVKVNVVKYACTDTIEERIDRILVRKQDLFDRLIDDVSLDLSARMSREELLGLFGLEMPRALRGA